MLLRLLFSKLGSALAATSVTAAAGVALTYLGANVLERYGFALFLAAPLVLGLLATLIHGLAAPRSLASCVGVAAIALTAASAALVAVALEGVICLVMAAPLTYGLAAVGALVGYRLQRHGEPRPSPPVLGAVLLLAPALMGVETAWTPEPRLRAVTTEIVVEAPPAVVWPHVVAVDELPAPRELVFRAGVAYPTRATIVGTGVGAVRRCEFSTGTFVEPVTVWIPGRVLEFRIASQPAPLRELSPHEHVHAPHLDGFLRSQRGRFELTPLPGGRTLVRGTSWYRNRMWPERYWAFLSDALARRIHARVLRHVRDLAEADARVAAAARPAGRNRVRSEKGRGPLDMQRGAGLSVDGMGQDGGELTRRRSPTLRSGGHAVKGGRRIERLAWLPRTPLRPFTDPLRGGGSFLDTAGIRSR